MSNALFCYGTLQSSLVMKAVTGCEFISIPAELHSYTMFRVRGTDYPGIIPKKGVIVRGILYDDITDEVLRTLDRFEGDHYFRNEVTVFRSDGRAVETFAYCIREHQKGIMSEEAWDFGTFLDEGIEQFMRGFVEERRNIFGEN